MAFFLAEERAVASLPDLVDDLAGSVKGAHQVAEYLLLVLGLLAADLPVEPLHLHLEELFLALEVSVG